GEVSLEVVGVEGEAARLVVLAVGPAEQVEGGGGGRGQAAVGAVAVDEAVAERHGFRGDVARPQAYGSAQRIVGAEGDGALLVAALDQAPGGVVDAAPDAGVDALGAEHAVSQRATGVGHVWLT